MKRLCVAGFALFVASLGIPVLVQGNSSASTQNDEQFDLMDIKGTVRSENTKITFVADEGGSPGMWSCGDSKGSRGQHVQVNAHVDSDKGQIHVVSVMLL
jgi:hypothetical protein